MDWWRRELNPEGLSQGDILSDVLVGSAHDPRAYLGRDVTTKGTKKVWPEAPTFDTFKTDQTGYYIARGRQGYGIVLSHSCDLDKGRDKSGVLVALVSPMSQIQNPTQRNSILAQRHFAFLPLPDIPGLGTCYADLRRINYVARKSIQNESRLASMSADGATRLHAQLIGFFTRLDFSQIAAEKVGD